MLGAACELFYAEGIHTVGIDRVIERAGVAKASLYNTFGSKEGLIRAYLLRKHETIRNRIERALDGHDDPRDKILALFASQAAQFADPTYRGCPFANASAESERGGAVEEASDSYRAWLLTTFVELATAAGADDPQVAGRQLLLLYDGAAASARLDRYADAGAVTRAAVTLLLDRHLPPRSPRAAQRQPRSGATRSRIDSRTWAQ